MSRRIAPPDSLESLKREAKRWLKALQANGGDAHARFRAALPDAPPHPTLRTVQHALARELGFPGWTALKEHLAGERDGEQPSVALIDRFLDNACPDHHVRGGPDHVRAHGTAMRMLARVPALAGANFFTKVVVGDLAGVAADLRVHPELAQATYGPAPRERTSVGGSDDLVREDLEPKGWSALLFVCFTRLALPAVDENAVAIARTLLEHGADPNAYFMAGDSRYTPLVGAIGEGEEDRPPHPRRDELVRLLFDHGAEFASSPGKYNGQVGYNIHFHGRVLWYLKLMHEYSIRRGQSSLWSDPEWNFLGQGGYGSGARWHLWIAERNNDLELAEWCLAHGANPNSQPAKATNLPRRSLYEEALHLGETELAELLLRHGAERIPVEVSPLETLVAATKRFDREGIRAQVARHPELLRAPEPLMSAAGEDRADVVEFLLDVGMSPNVENAEKERPLHAAAYKNAVGAAKLLLARGAEIDAVESNWENTALGAAVYAQHHEMIDLLSRSSRDVWGLATSGKLERLREVFADDPDRARITGDGHTPLMWLPADDERRAMAVARLLIANGADPSIVNPDGMTAADRADRLAMPDVAACLRSAAAPPARAATERFLRMATDLLAAYRTGTPEAMQRHWADTWHRRTWEAMRRYVQLDLGRQPKFEGEDMPISLDDARWLVARDNGFTSWDGLIENAVAKAAETKRLAGAPVRVVVARDDELEPIVERTRDWDAALAMIRERHLPDLDANGQMTDDILADVSRLGHVSVLRLAGSKALTDAGVAHLARMVALTDLDLGGCAITDSAMSALAALPNLRRIRLAGTRVTDDGIEKLSACARLVRVDLSWTNTGDRALRALAGKQELSHFHAGNHVTDAGLPALHEFPVFKTWRGGAITLGLTSPEAQPNMLWLRGTITDRGIAALAGLDGLFGLNIDDSNMPVTAAGLSPLVGLPHLGMFAFDATDEAMPYIAAMPDLRFLMCQDTAAGDEGFVALSRSQSIEYIWGRRCYNLRSRGFAALASIPTLRSLSVSCRNVDDSGLSVLPHFPALRELMPMDVLDDGYRFIGQCRDLESLVLMYCRETGDVATSHVTSLGKLTKYFASYTRATDRTLEYLSEIPSLESVDLAGIPGMTTAGFAALTKLPRLRLLRLGGMQHVDLDALPTFGPGVRVSASL